MFRRNKHDTVAAIAASLHPLLGAAGDYDPLLALIGDARFVLIGEATHGTHEFYAERAAVTRRLIVELGFDAVAVEADWPDAYRVNRYVRCQGDDASAARALDGFRRFPGWMWRNRDVVDFIDWLRAHNARRPAAARTGFYGLDLYSLFTSIEEVLHYLDRVDPAAAREARARYGCFDHYGDSQRYAYAAGFGMSDSCEDGVVAQLLQLQQRAVEYVDRNAPDAADAYFHARQNALLVKNAEEYYRTMFRGTISSWNLRDRHMADTLDALERHVCSTLGRPARIVVWAHNSHIGDARATETSRVGEWNLGQLARERHGGAVRLIGMSTSRGWVTAASHWEGMAERKRVLPALRDSIEELLHDTGTARFILPLGQDSAAQRVLQEQRLERAIGVLYLPRTERQSHYFYADVARQFDALVHIDETEAVEPLEPASRGPDGEVAETFPVGV